MVIRSMIKGAIETHIKMREEHRYEYRRLCEKANSGIYGAIGFRITACKWLD